jgi:hypothetical protein
MQRLSGFGTLVVVIGSALIIHASLAKAQIVGAVQYPPPSVGADAQPPPPAGMVPQTVSPRRIELGISGSSQPFDQPEYQLRLRTGSGRFTEPRPAPLGPSAASPPTAAGD